MLLAENPQVPTLFVHTEEEERWEYPGGTWCCTHTWEEGVFASMRDGVGGKWCGRAQNFLRCPVWSPTTWIPPSKTCQVTIF